MFKLKNIEFSLKTKNILPLQRELFMEIMGQ